MTNGSVANCDVSIEAVFYGYGLPNDGVLVYYLY